MKTNRFFQKRLLQMIVPFCLFLCTSPLAPSMAEDGFTTQSGALPLGAEGTASLWVTPCKTGLESGNIGIGVSNPVANLDVARGVKIGIDELFLGSRQPCRKTGTLSIDPATRRLHWCDGTSWLPLSN